MAVNSASESELRNKFAAIRKWQAISRTVTILTVLIVAVMFFVFYTTTRSEVEGAYRQEGRIQKAVQEAVPDVQPQVQAMLQRVSEEVLPQYRDLAQERYARVRENIGTKAAIRLQKLPEDGGKLMSEKLNATLAKTLKRVEPEFAATFPALSDPKKRDELIVEFFKEVEEKNGAIAAKIDAIRVNETGRVKAVLDKFALPPDQMAGKDEELGKELIRTMLLLAQHHLEEMDGTTTASTGSTGGGRKASPTTAPSVGTTGGN